VGVLVLMGAYKPRRLDVLSRNCTRNFSATDIQFQPPPNFNIFFPSDRLLVRLPPGIYRLDFDGAGFPIDWRTNVDALAVDLIAGSYTPVLIPLNRSDIVSGVVNNAEGK
jgi:hypothetical protein